MVLNMSEKESDTDLYLSPEWGLKGHMAHFTINCELLTSYSFFLTIIFSSFCFFPIDIFRYDYEKLLQSLKIQIVN